MMFTRKIITTCLALLFCLCLAGAVNAAQPGYKTIGLDEFSALQQKAMQGEKNPLLLDVRSGPEFFAGHIPGTNHIPTQLLPRVTEILTDKSVPIVVFCRTQNRATPLGQGPGGAGVQGCDPVHRRYHRVDQGRKGTGQPVHGTL